MKFQAPGADLQKGLPKCAPGASPGASGERPRRPKTATRSANSAPRRPQEPPRAPQAPPRGSLRAARAAMFSRPRPQVAPGGLQGVILEPSGLNFGPSGGPFSKPPVAFFEPSGELPQSQSQAQEQAQGQEPRKGGHKAATHGLAVLASGAQRRRQHLETTHRKRKRVGGTREALTIRISTNTVYNHCLKRQSPIQSST